jgi:hypothetical protein
MSMPRTASGPERGAGVELAQGYREGAVLGNTPCVFTHRGELIVNRSMLWVVRASSIVPLGGRAHW